jgi:LCP family protein required for cell wall assembly
MPSMTTSSPTHSSAKAFLAAFASALIPGVGQFIAGDKRKGTVLVGIDAVILVGLVLMFPDEISIAKAWIKPSTLALMMVGNILFLGFRIWAADDAYRTAKGLNQPGAGVSSAAVFALGGVIVAMLVLPHVAFGYFDVVQYDLITSVFDNPTTTTVAAQSGTTTPPSTDATGATVPTTAQETTTTSANVPAIWNGLDRLNILLIGGDFGEGRTGIRTDTMITVSIDPVTGETAMFSVPRNWTGAPLPEGMGIWDCDCYPELINELWVMGDRHPEAFPGPGSPSENAVKGVISEFLGIPIHYYAMVNLDGFVDVVDALGGVEVYVPTRVVDEEYPSEDGIGTERIVIEPGLNTFDGHLALAYARTRHQDSDYFRMSRQRCVIEAMVDQADPLSLLSNFGSLAGVIKDSMMTDIPIDALPQLVELKPAIDLENIVSVRFIPPDYHLKFRDDGKAGRIANTPLVHEHVQLVIDDPERAIVELGLENLEDVCGEPGT